MPNRTRKKSVADLLAKVPVQRGSLLGGIENLLKTIDSSESAVMIPTLLRDKCEFDAWELLFVAKILRASILGHIDLVEFYMNHIGLNMSQYTEQDQLASNTTGLSKQSQTNDVSSNGIHPVVTCAPASPSLSSVDTSSLSSLSATTSAKWTTTSSTTTATEPTTDSNISNSDRDLKESVELSFLTSPLNKLNNRVPQPPTLLNLTTNNNHINSLTNGCTDTCNDIACSVPPEPLSISTGPITSTGTQVNLSHQDAAATKLAAEFEHMSINRSVSSSTTTNFLAALRPNSGASSPRTCWAQTAGTPCPQAETLALGAQGKLLGDASAPVKLLLQIEQLKCSIVNVTSLLDSVVELYKKSIDNIALP